MTELTYQHFFGGMVGGMFGTFISHPIDTMRIRLQTDKQIITNVQCLKNISPSNQVSYIMRDLYSLRSSTKMFNLVTLNFFSLE